MIIGLTGSNCSGKDTIAEYIVKEHEYKHCSLSDVIREIMKEENIETTRENLIAFGTKLREKNGYGFLARKALEKIELNNSKYCITSIRHPDEVKELKKRKDFVLINVDSPMNIRFERMQRRNRQGDPQIFEKFIELEEKEYRNKGAGQQLKETMKMADITFINDSNDMKTLEVKIDELLKNIEDKYMIKE
ncbi:MAG: dephospho-CoA kinase [Endomicrobium sp.]|jgi:dephospho-CoA kinase|nr:dephospho-CoA kinase [Endomicrobium sp.]